MLKKTVTYEDPFTNEMVTEDLYFNITKAELVEWEVSVGGEGLKSHLENIARAENGKQIMDEMKGIILKAYGKRFGSSFIKNDQVREEFASSEAYSTLFMEMVTDADAAVTFVRGILPKDLEDSAQEQLPVDRPNLTALQGEREALRYPHGVDVRPESKLPGEITGEGPRRISHAEAVAMNSEELRSGLAEGRYILQ